MALGPGTYCGDEPVQRLPSLCVLDRDGAEVIAEPDGGDNAAGVAVGNVLLQERGRRECDKQNQPQVGGGVDCRGCPGNLLSAAPEALDRQHRGGALRREIDHVT